VFLGIGFEVKVLVYIPAVLVAFPVVLVGCPGVLVTDFELMEFNGAGTIGIIRPL